MKWLMLWIGLSGLLFAQYLGSYTARISHADHYSSRGASLHSAADILQQDRANYYRFGKQDNEDQGTGYFEAHVERNRFARMLSRGALSWSLAQEIIYGTPLIKVDIYSNYIDIHSTSTIYREPKKALPAHRTPQIDTTQTLSHLLEQDARKQVLAYARGHPMWFLSSNLKHKPEGVYFSREADQDIAWVVIASSPQKNFECHACVPVLSLLVYHKEDSRTWKLKQYAYKAFQGGSGWDNPPGRENMALVHLSSSRCALAIRTGYANMGWGMSYYNLVTVDNTEAHTIFSTTLSEENGGTGSAVQTNWKSTLKLKPGAGRYYDIHLHRQGIIKNKPFDYKIVYRYNKVSYKPLGVDMVMQK